ncbi:trafficking protein Mon1-domain-containing protein [Mycena maculata]|uniref:Vacuolar fusion protein MON1 n=1 Tax=Mycena maculata TaxID=230809 RepID=A0AAD7KB63_9AGAR|nr:trafficking protein Mon1-domain-containing protein [Mycena maculata]
MDTPRTRSRTSSRAQLARSSPSRLAIPPALRPSPSLSSLRVHSYAAGSSTVATSESAPTVTFQPPSNPILDSTASSVVNLDLNEGILIQDADTDTVDGEDITVMGVVHATDEASKKSLRDQLRRTLSHRPSRLDMISSRTRRKGRHASVHEIPPEIGSRYLPRQYFILTDAGKPVFTSRAGGEDSENMTSTIGIMQALISVFIDDGDKIRCINAGSTRITFALRAPLYYVCSSSWGEPESVARSHLEYLHLQILSIVTATQLRRVFERRTNFDLRRLLNGSETFLTSLLARLEFDLAMSTSSLHCLRLEASIRKRAAEALVPPSKMKDILYVVFVARGRVITLVRPRKHSIHPADIHILLNTIHSPSILNSPASASWIPVCLPKFNPSGFVNAYISFPRKDDGLEAEQRTPSDIVDGQDAGPSVKPRYAFHALDSGIGLICISGGGDFETIRNWCDSATDRMESDGTLDTIANAFRSGHTEYSVAELGIPGLRHFLYKSRAQVQITCPTFEDPYDNIDERRRLTTLYQILHDAIHAKSGQEASLKLQYIRSEKESVMGWITQPFELYITLSPRLPKSAAVGAANAVARWVKKEESRLFLRDAPVF